MKNIVLTNEVAQVILNKVEAFKSDKNRLQLKIGLKSLGDGLACQTVLVNGGMMAEIGFKTADLPADYVGGSESYFTVNVSANHFISYLKAFLPFNANITLEYDENSTLYMQVDGSARISIPTTEEMDPLLPCDHRSAYAMIKLDTKKFLSALKVGAFAATSAPDSRGITDRVVLKFLQKEVVAYSTDSIIMSKAWCDAVAQFNKPNQCVAYLNQKLEVLEDTKKEALIEKIKKVMTDPQATVKLAEEEGFKDGPLSIALPATSIAVLRTIFGGTEHLNVMVTPNHLVVNSGNILATFSLSGRASEVYAKSVDPWQNTSWTGQALVDKEALMNSLAIVALSASQVTGKKGSVPFRTSFRKGKMVLTDKLDNEVSLPVVNATGELAKVNIYLDVEKVSAVLGKLPNGNVVLRYFVSPNGSCDFPVSFSSGDIEGNGISSYTYILPVNIKKAEEQSKEGDTKKQSKKDTKDKENDDASVKETNSSNEDIPDLDEPDFDNVM